MLSLHNLNTKLQGILKAKTEKAFTSYSRRKLEHIFHNGDLVSS